MSEFTGNVSKTNVEETTNSSSKRTIHVPINDNLVNYGILSKNVEGYDEEKRFYVSTAIAYTNGYPHIGHAYEFLTADVIARNYRAMGYNTFFLTGSDEHGQKVAASAEKNNLAPIDHCDIYVNSFKALNQRLAISNDYYQRTTEPYHEETAKKLWKRCADRGDIYLSTYEGWYNEREETFVTDSDAEASDYKDPSSGVPLKRVSEESYFFRMSKYETRLIEVIENNPEFIQPEQFRTQILTRLKKDGLRDLSISRTTFKWGIPVPEGFKDDHVMYVWFDALSNYGTGVHFLDDSHPLSKFWPANCHLIGKDIIWFHSVIWPCMLMSAEIPLPKGVFSHGFVNASDGRKMSKSFGNTIDPNDTLDLYPVDSIRYYSVASITYGTDLNFAPANLVQMHNSELADILGNLIHRVLTLSGKYCNGVVPDIEKHDAQYGTPFDISAIVNTITEAMSTYAIHTALFVAMEAVRNTNKWLTEAEPWKMKGEDEPRRVVIVRTALEAMYAFAHFLAPVIPHTCRVIFEERLHTAPMSILKLNPNFFNLKPGTTISQGDVLFTKIEDPESKEAASEKENELKKKKAVVTKKPPAFVANMEQNEFTRMEFRVGEIIKVWNHPTADRLYCEEISFGSDLPVRTIASGLRDYYTTDQLLNRKVVVVCNLKDAKLQGFVSQGMVLATKNIELNNTELIDVPIDSMVGERIFLDGVEQEPAWPVNPIKKYKVWESVALNLKTNDECVATWNGYSLMTSSGCCTVASNKNNQIS